jgi:hypothetical protein
MIFCVQDFMDSLRIAIAFFTETKEDLKKISIDSNLGRLGLEWRLSAHVYFNGMRKRAQDISDIFKAFRISCTEVHCTNIIFFQ